MCTIWFLPEINYEWGKPATRVCVPVWSVVFFFIVFNSSGCLLYRGDSGVFRPVAVRSAPYQHRSLEELP